MKKCFKCNEIKSLQDFYKHPAMKDGHLNKCIACTKKDVHEHRELNILKIRAYDRKRGNRQPLDYFKTEKAKLAARKSRKKWIISNEQKRKAHLNIIRALRNRIIKKLPCDVCGNLKTEAHHFDYNRELDVIWLCKKHHAQKHKEMNSEDRQRRGEE